MLAMAARGTLTTAKDNRLQRDTLQARIMDIQALRILVRCLKTAAETSMALNYLQYLDLHIIQHPPQDLPLCLRNLQCTPHNL